MAEESVYFRDGELVTRSDEVRVFKLNNKLFLENGKDNLICSDNKREDYVWQIDKKPFGNCLVLGLGLGIAPRYIYSLDKVDNVLVVEEDMDIIKVHNEINERFKYKIIEDDYLNFLYKSADSYDFIFLDCYDRINNTTIPFIADIAAASKKVLKPNGVLIGWLDKNTPEVTINSFYSLFNI